MTWIIAVGVVVLIGLILVVFSIAMPKFKIIQKLVDKLNLVTRENLSGMMVIRAFGTQKFEENRFDKANQDLTRTNLFVNRVMVFMMPTMMFMMTAITLVIVWVGAHQIEQSAMQVGDMMAFMQYAMQIIMAFLMIAMMSVSYTHLKASSVFPTRKIRKCLFMRSSTLFENFTTYRLAGPSAPNNYSAKSGLWGSKTIGRLRKESSNCIIPLRERFFS